MTEHPKEKKATEANVTVQCRITEKEAEELDRAAEELGVERSWIVREALRQFKVEHTKLFAFLSESRGKTKPHAVA